MTSLLTNLDAVLDTFVTRTVGPTADAVDASGQFPQTNIAAFLAAGLGGLISSRDSGGAGGGIRDASKVVERVGRVCGSTAMIICMHYCAVQVIEALLCRALRKLATNERLKVTGHHEELGLHLRAWCRVLGYHFEPTSDGSDNLHGTITPGAHFGKMPTERAGDASPAGVADRPPQHWGLAGRSAEVELGGPAFDFGLVDKIDMWTDDAARFLARLHPHFREVIDAPHGVYATRQAAAAYCLPKSTRLR